MFKQMLTDDRAARLMAVGKLWKQISFALCLAVNKEFFSFRALYRFMVFNLCENVRRIAGHF